MTATTPIRVDDAEREPAPVLTRLALERAGPLEFRTVPGPVGTERLFGGEVAAQAMLAAAATVEPARRAHSLTAQYLRPGDPELPVTYRVAAVRDGGSFSTRTVDAYQGQSLIFVMTSSFQLAQVGFDHQFPVLRPGLDLPAPEACADVDASQSAWVRDVMTRLPVEIRFAESGPPRRTTGPEPRLRTYVRTRGVLPDDELIHTAALIYLSDLLMISAALVPHEPTMLDRSVTTATISHAVWLHGALPADEWFLYDVEGSWAGGGRTLSHGRIFDAAGRLRATTAQEGLARRRP